jgi:TolA-binding protein
VGPGLKDQLDQATRESQELKRVIQNNEQAMEKVREKYADDKARFRQLSGNPQ